MHSLKKISSQEKSQKGFTVIEMSVVMIISGLITLAIFSAYHQYYEQMKIEKADRAVLAAKNALIQIVPYPCPARAGLTLNDPMYGVADCTIAPDANGLLHGVLPNVSTVGANTVNLSDYKDDFDSVQTNYLDSWGRQLSYTVTESLSNAAPPGTFDANNGAIQIHTEFGDIVENRAHFVVHTSGQNSGCPETGTERENCDNDNVFVDSLQYNTDDDMHYDDHLAFFTRNSASLWTPQLSSSGIVNNNVVASNTGNVGIGTNSPKEKVEVVGNLNATTSVKANKICDTPSVGVGANANCMLPESLYSISKFSTACSSQEYIKSVTVSTTGQITTSCAKITFTPSNFDCGTKGVRAISSKGNIRCN